MAKKSMVHLRVYKGAKMFYDENGKAQNENQLVKIQHGSFEWNNFLKMAKLNGYCKIEVEKVLDVSGFYEDEKILEVDDVGLYEKEILESTKEKEKELTPEQKRIQELEKKINSLLKKETDSKDVKQIDVKDAQVEDGFPEELEDVQKLYEEELGKKAHYKASRETLIQQIKENKTNS